MLVVERHPEHRVRQQFGDRAGEFQYVFLCHSLSIGARPNAEGTALGGAPYFRHSLKLLPGIYCKMAEKASAKTADAPDTDPGLRLIRAGREGTVAPADLETLAADHAACHVDIGCGDGLYPYRLARDRPDILALGIDAAADNLWPTARKAARKPAKGGAGNCAFLIAAVEALPETLPPIADRITVLFPWGSLLRGLIAADSAVLRPVSRLARPGAALSCLVNLHTFQAAGLRAAADLPDLTEDHVQSVLVPGFTAHGWAIETAAPLGDRPLPARTSWGQRLTKGSERATFEISAKMAQ